MTKLLHLSILQILRYVWKGDLLRSRYVKLEKVLKEGNNRYHFITSTREEDGQYHIHHCWVYSADADYNGKLIQCNAVKTSCDCERWKFTFEVSQGVRNAADIIYSDGDLPYDRNPKLKISVCKHLIVALRYILANQL